VLHAVRTLRDTSLGSDPKAPKPLTRIDAPVNGKVKQTVLGAQEAVAFGLATLELAEAELDVVGELRAKEPKRWQAHYDFALAQVKLRLAALHEYNKLLGDVRTEVLPGLPEGGTGWRLVSSPRLQSRAAVKKLAEAGTAGLREVAAAYKGTPWEVLARRALLAPLGLAWEPVGR
jgi:hypothetical protein